MKGRAGQRQGSISLFLCILITAISLVINTWASAAHLRYLETQLSAALSAQCQCILANYDRQLFRCFGLLGFRETAGSDYILNSWDLGICRPAEMHLTVRDPLLETATLDEQIVRQMKTRLPFNWLEVISRRFGLSDQEQKQTVRQASKINGLNLSGKLNTYLQKIDRANILEVVQLLFGSLGDELADEKINGLRSKYEQIGLELSAVTDNPLLAGLGRQLASFFDPAEMSRIALQLDNFLNFPLATPYEKLCVTEYLFTSLTCAVSAVDAEAGALLRNPDQLDLAQLTKDRPFEAEQVLTGLKDADKAALAVKVCLTALRSIVHVIAIITDAVKMEKIQLAAEVLCGACQALTSGAVTLPPDAVAFVFVAGQALGAGYKEAVQLMAGKAVRFWPGLGDLKIDLRYQDYLRLFALFLPRASIVTNLSHLLERLTGGGLYTTATVAVLSRGRWYEQTSGYQS